MIFAMTPGPGRLHNDRPQGGQKDRLYSNVSKIGTAGGILDRRSVRWRSVRHGGQFGGNRVRSKERRKSKRHW
jgi:hypothetical protein